MSRSLTVLGLIYVIIFSIFGCPCVLSVFEIEISSWELLPQSPGNLSIWMVLEK